MITDRVMRSVLWAGVAYNAAIAVLLAFPVALAPISGLPAPGSLFYPWVLALFVAIFGGAYAWLALQPDISRPVVALAAIGKAGAFCVALACLLRGDIGGRTFSAAVVDLAFAMVFLAWLRAGAARK